MFDLPSETGCTLVTLVFSRLGTYSTNTNFLNLEALGGIRGSRTTLVSRHARRPGCLEEDTGRCVVIMARQSRNEGTSHRRSGTRIVRARPTRPFGQSTGWGFSFTRFRMHRGYQTLTKRQQDVFAPWMGPGPNHPATIRTLYEIGYILTHADPICSHLQWAEEYPFLIPNMANFGLDPTFSLPITALDLEPQAAPLLPGRAETHKRLWCALFHRADCECPDSIAFKALYVFGRPLPPPRSIC